MDQLMSAITAKNMVNSGHIYICDF